MEIEGSTASLERASDIEKDPAGTVKRWLLELKLADKREEDWRKKGDKVWARYRQKDAKRNSFNILWANTETLRPAVYNSVPKPDVRRRYKDADPLGKAVSDVLGRSLEYGLDTGDFDSHIKLTALDMLLPGRGVARVRYVPTLAAMPEEQEGDEGEALEGDAEELQWEQAPIEHVQWDDFRMSSGKEWGEVCWIAFRHRLKRDELERQFGAEIGGAVQLDATDDKDVEAEKDEGIKSSFKTAEVWEIWDKDSRTVLFVSQGHKESPLKVIPDPLNLQGFFPSPRPIYAVEDSSSLVPVPLYDLYKEQADELDQVTRRINILVNGLKLRGIYDSTLSEMSEIMRGEDNDLIPADNVTALLERGGLEKAIWFMPIQQAAMVLKELYVQRDQTKGVIYEITGISDILRGSSVASETATAQQIKNQWGTMRLKRMQAEVARFIRDLLRLQAEIIGEKFQPETLQQMTGLQFPTMEQKQQAIMQAQQQGQQPPQIPPSWEEILQVLRDDKQRTFKVDVETDSTVAASVETDMDALEKLLGGVVKLIQGFAPAVQAGMMPMEAVKEMILAATRRAKLGNAVEDALDKMQQPAPQPNPEAAKAQQDAQAKQMQMEQDERIEQMRLVMEERSRQSELQAEMRLEAFKEQLVAEREERQAEREAIIRHQELMQDQAFERFKALLEARTEIEKAEISAGATLDAAQIGAANQGADDAGV